MRVGSEAPMGLNPAALGLKALSELERAGYSFHYGDLGVYGDDPELAGKHWWCLCRPGWSGIETQEGTSATLDEAVQDALTHVMDEAVYGDMSLQGVSGFASSLDVAAAGAAASAVG